MKFFYSFFDLENGAKLAYKRQHNVYILCTIEMKWFTWGKQDEAGCKKSNNPIFLT